MNYIHCATEIHCSNLYSKYWQIWKITNLSILGPNSMHYITMGLCPKILRFVFFFFLGTICIKGFQWTRKNGKSFFPARSNSRGAKTVGTTYQRGEILFHHFYCVTKVCFHYVIEVYLCILFLKCWVFPREVKRHTVDKSIALFMLFR